MTKQTFREGIESKFLILVQITSKSRRATDCDISAKYRRYSIYIEYAGV